MNVRSTRTFHSLAGINIAKCSKTNCKVDMAKDLMRVVEKHKKELKGVCLGCIKGANYNRNAFRKSSSKHGLKTGD